MAKTTKKSETYKITFEGTYYAREGGGKTRKHFECDYVTTRAHVEKYSALGVFKKFGANQTMPRLYPDFVGLAKFKVKTTTILEKPDAAPVQLELKNRDELIAYIIDQELPIEAILYSKDGALRQAIKDCEADEEQFLRNQSLLANRVGGDLEAAAELAELNAATITTEVRPTLEVEPAVTEFTKEEAKRIAELAEQSKTEAKKGRSTGKSKAADDEMSKLGL
jgi:hypothetical protein